MAPHADAADFGRGGLAMTVDLALVWAAIIAFAVFMYVVMDGFDLGIGILFPSFREEADRDTMMNAVAPVWDGNETWLVLGGGGLLAAFPLAYATILPALYLPLIVMLIGLIFRGVAFEFRFKAERHRRRWDVSFAGGSMIATFAQGVALGAFVQGFHVQGRSFAGGAFDWLTPFSLFTGLALIAGYAALGCAWLILKTEGALQARAWTLMIPLGLALLAAIAVVSIWTPLAHPAIAARWFSWPNILYLSPVPLAVAVLAVLLWRAEARHDETAPFPLALGLFALGYVGLGISLWPHVVPPRITIWDAAASAATQTFMLYGVVVLIPLILGYTAYSYYVFRGKVSGSAYHR
jgi:cytochrome d ubiquinol oxidase subunit II